MQISPPQTVLALAAIALLSSSCQTKPSPNFLVADTDGSGALTKSELDHFTATQFHAVYDANGDGGISFAEMQQVKPDTTKAGFASRDTDGNGKIDLAEMVAAVRRNPTFGRLMETIDTNKDGLAQPSETAEFRKHMPEL